jgi:hypothetical protein
MKLNRLHKRVHMGDEPCSTLEGQEGPCPLHHDDKTVLETYQVHNMYRHPGDPGQKTTNLQL